MIKSKEWNWNVVTGDFKKVWLEPCITSFYLLNRWQGLNKKKYLDLGCGLGRHTILFAENGFDTYAFDLSHEAVQKTMEYAKQNNLKVNCQEGDMLNLPYDNNSFDCIMCFNVISHTDTEGIKKIIQELKRVLKDDGEVYLTLCSKETWGFQQSDWPMVDENTRLRMDDGPEKGVPHFYADYNLIRELFSDFEIVQIFQEEDFYPKDNEVKTSKHFHLLIKKIKRS